MKERRSRMLIDALRLVPVLLAIAVYGCSKPPPPPPPAPARAPVQEQAPEPALEVWPPPAPTSSPPAAVSNAPPPVAFPEIQAEGSDPAGYRGRKLEEFMAAFGRPVGRIQKGGHMALYYANFVAHSEDGATVSSIENAAATRSGPAGSAPVSRPTAKAEKTPAAAPAVVETISNGGKEVLLNKVLVPGRVTVLDFYAEWSGPCHILNPHLEALVRKEQDAVLRKIDIVNWQSDVASQYEVRTVPSVRVYDKRGRQVGEPSSSLEAIQRNLSQAKKQ